MKTHRIWVKNFAFMHGQIGAIPWKEYKYIFQLLQG